MTKTQCTESLLFNSLQKPSSAQHTGSSGVHQLLSHLQYEPNYHVHLVMKLWMEVTSHLQTQYTFMAWCRL